MFLRGCLFSLLLVIPFGYLNYRYKNTNYYKQLNGLGKFCTVPEDIQILNLGNSHERMGIVYEKNTDLKGYNMALDSQPFEYDYYILDYYSDKLAEDAIVIIPISYFDYYYNYEEIFMGDISVYNERYYSILDKEHIMNYEIDKDILYYKIPLLTAGKSMGYIFQDVQWKKQSGNSTKVQNIISEADYKYKSWTEEVMATTTGTREKCKKMNLKYLKKTIDYCYNNGYTPVLTTLPMTEELISRFSEEFKKDFYNNCALVLGEYPELEYLDYSADDQFSMNLNYFKDSDHLNIYGANEFSERLFSDLEKIRVLPEGSLGRF